MNRHVAVLLCLFATGLACSSSQDTSIAEPAADGGGGGAGTDGGGIAAFDASPSKDSGAADPDAGTLTWCAALKDKMDTCDNERQCGTKLDAWCALQTKTNSAVYEAADKVCLKNCDGDARADCRYRLYKTSDMTAAQKALVADYCATCTPGVACAGKVTSYDPNKGTKGVTDAFIAVWELSDAITEKIRTTCTGDALPGKNGDCPKAFGQCAADVYLNALPECP
jgi:hypothetical protein